MLIRNPRFSLIQLIFFITIGSVSKAQEISLGVRALTEPTVFNTFEVEEVELVPVVSGLSNPFGMAFRENGDILITERYTGKIRLVRDNKLQLEEVGVLTDFYSDAFRAGLMAIVIHPDDEDVIYLTYTKSIEYQGEQTQTVALLRGELVDSVLTKVEEIFVAEGLDTAIAGSVLLFGPDNKLFMTVGGAYAYAATADYAQDGDVHYGKLLRLNEDGSAPRDNPFVESGEFLPEVFSIGHRNQLGLALHPETGELWASENGPQGGDEVNIIAPGKNYGWPLVSFSRQYRGDWVSDLTRKEGFEAPTIIWWPSIAPAGMTFYTGNHFPEWQGNLFVGSLIEGRIPGTGHLERIVFNSRGEELRRESLFTGLRQRVRDVQQGPDGHLYFLTDEEDGALLRIEPVF